MICRTLTSIYPFCSIPTNHTHTHTHTHRAQLMVSTVTRELLDSGMLPWGCKVHSSSWLALTYMRFLFFLSVKWLSCLLFSLPFPHSSTVTIQGIVFKDWETVWRRCDMRICYQSWKLKTTKVPKIPQSLMAQKKKKKNCTQRLAELQHSVIFKRKPVWP